MSRNPSVAGQICAICGRPAVSFCHIDHKGMGGDPTGIRADGFASCGRDHSDPTTCHGALGQHLLTAERRNGVLWYTPSEAYSKVLRRRGVSCRAGQWRPALHEGQDPDAIDARREEVSR